LRLYAYTRFPRTIIIILFINIYKYKTGLPAGDLEKQSLQWLSVFSVQEEKYEIRNTSTDSKRRYW
jgi:hypothetical protein